MLQLLVLVRAHSDAATKSHEPSGMRLGGVKRHCARGLAFGWVFYRLGCKVCLEKLVAEGLTLSFGVPGQLGLVVVPLQASGFPACGAYAGCVF